MDRDFYNKLKCVFKFKDLTREILYPIFRVLDDDELLKSLSSFFENSSRNLLMFDDFFEEYYFFLYNLNDLDIDIEILIKKNIDALKEIARIYNKQQKQKDVLYYRAKDAINHLKRIKYFIKKDDLKETNLYSMIWFLVVEIQNVDYLFSFFNEYPEYINIKSSNGRPIFINLLDFLLSNIDTMDKKEILYYKRLFVMMLENGNLNLKADELDYVDQIFIKNENIAFIIYEIKRHFDNTGIIRTCVDYECNEIYIDNQKNCENRKTFDNEEIITIDHVRSLKNVLFDDAISIKENSDHTYNVHIHIPDVDYFIPINSRIDKIIRNMGESIYVRGFHRSLLPDQIGKLASLKEHELKPTLTFDIRIDNEGNVLNINFYESLIMVGHNYRSTDADRLLNNKNENLLLMSKVAKILRKNRKVFCRSKLSSLAIVEELNILADLATAQYFKENEIIFPYKNYLGNASIKYGYIEEFDNFSKECQLTEDEKWLLYNTLDYQNRVFYDTISYGNKSFKGRDVGNAGNPLREYISLETDRLIKELVIKKANTSGVWSNRIQQDVIEYTETTNKIKKLSNNVKSS